MITKGSAQQVLLAIDEEQEELQRKRVLGLTVAGAQDATEGGGNQSRMVGEERFSYRIIPTIVDCYYNFCYSYDDYIYIYMYIIVVSSIISFEY